MIKRTLAIATLLALSASVARADDAVRSVRQYLTIPDAVRAEWAKQSFISQPLAKAEAAEVQTLLWADTLAQVQAERAGEWQQRALTFDGETMKFDVRTFGNKPAAGWDLYISLHGGGNTQPAVNDQQWENQKRLYSPANSLYIAPRAPTNSWDLWHEPHVDVLIGRLIENAIAFGGANPNRVYLMGYSAGGDGVYQLAPRMADRFAAAAMMAGHPNDASPLGLRNLPFTIHVGALDNGFDRNKIALEWREKLDALRVADPKGYAHEVTLHEGRAHWMEREDAVALDWMARYDRVAQPDRVVWVQARAIHDRFYWLATTDASVKPGAVVEAERDGQTIRIVRAEGVRSLNVLLNDAMVDLDRPVEVRRGEQVLFKGVVPRTADAMRQGLRGRLDPDARYCATVALDLSNQVSSTLPAEAGTLKR